MKILRQGDDIMVHFHFPQGQYSYCRNSNGDWHYRPHQRNWIRIKASLVPASVVLRVQRFLQDDERKTG